MRVKRLVLLARYVALRCNSNAAAAPSKSVDHYARLLRQCCEQKALEQGKQLHRELRELGYENNDFLRNFLLHMYVKCGALDEAREAFASISRRNEFVWNLMISGYVKAGRNREALDLFHQMGDHPKPNAFIFASALAACAGLGSLEEGRVIHHRVLECSQSREDVVVQNALVTMYAKCGEVREGMKLFNSIPKKNLVSWNAMISALVQCDFPRDAIDLYERMELERVQPNTFIFTSVLTACATLGNLDTGSRVHQRVLSSGLRPDIVVQNALINMYSKCGQMEEANRIFSAMSRKDVVTWTSMITGFALRGLADPAFEFYQEMKKSGVSPTSATFAGLLTACSTLEQGKVIHDELTALGFESSAVVETALMFMYSRCGDLELAGDIFDRMRERDVVCWTAMVTIHAQFGAPDQALLFFRRMLVEGLRPVDVTFCSVLQACSVRRDISQGRAIDELLTENGSDAMEHLQEDLVFMYSRCGAMAEARRVFDTMGNSGDVITWTALIKGYAQVEDFQTAFEMYEVVKSREPEKVDSTLVSVAIAACSGAGDLERGKSIADELLPGDLRTQPVGNALLKLYVRCESLEDAVRAFERMEERDDLSWRMMIEVFSQLGLNREAVVWYYRMLLEGERPGDETYSGVLIACGTPELLDSGRAIQKVIFECSGKQESPEIASALVVMYSRAGREEEALEVFALTRHHKRVVPWNTMISSLNRNGKWTEAVQLFKQMLNEGILLNAVSLMIAACACSRLGDAGFTREIHARAESAGLLDSTMRNALISAYARCNMLDDAREMFETVEEKTTVTWSSLIGAYSEAGLDREALEAYRRMDSEPDEVTFSSALQACSNLGSLRDGKEIHARIMDTIPGGKLSDFLGNSLITMYARCGGLHLAKRVFDSMPRSSRISWSVMMTVYALHGHHSDMIELHWMMLNEGVEPDGVSMIGVLNSCSHAGLRDDAWHYFASMVSDLNLPREANHYQCMIDMLCRCGRLDEAEEVMGFVEFKPDVMTWNTMLSACKNVDDFERGARAGKRMLLESRPVDSSPFILLSQIYSARLDTQLKGDDEF